MKRKNAYFTVEAAMVLPLAMGVILLAVYILLFQYNRCLAEQDAGLLAVWGSTLAGDADVLEEQMQERMEGIYQEKYVACKMQEMQMQTKGNVCVAEIKGTMRFPVFGWSIRNGEDFGNVEATYQYMRLQPMDFLRMCNKLMD